MEHVSLDRDQHNNGSFVITLLTLQVENTAFPEHILETFLSLFISLCFHSQLLLVPQQQLPRRLVKVFVLPERQVEDDRVRWLLEQGELAGLEAGRRSHDLFLKKPHILASHSGLQR